jgi:glutamyl-tRNA reductase
MVMELAVLGANHETAAVALRERLVLDGPRLEQFYREAAALAGFQGMVVLSTCNRTEVYWAGAVPANEILTVWARRVGLTPEAFEDHLYLYTDDRAVTHLFRVATGLDSMMLGETQILGQVKEAYQGAQAAGVVGSLHRLFLAALRVGKRAHRETGIGEHALSMGYAAVELARKIYGVDLANLVTVVLGAGEMGALAARHLRSAGVRRMIVVNRTRARAEALAAELGGHVMDFTALEQALTEADLVVSSTSAADPIIRVDLVRRVLRARRGRPLMLLDLAVPRDVEPGVEDVSEAVFRYDIDDLESVVAENRRRREREAMRVAQIIDEEREAFRREMDVANVGPVIRSLRAKAERIRQQELNAAWRELGHLSEHDREVVERTTRLILNKLLNDPMVSIRGWASRPEGPVYLEALRDLFRLDEPSAPATDDD